MPNDVEDDKPNYSISTANLTDELDSQNTICDHNPIYKDSSNYRNDEETSGRFWQKI